MNRGPPRRPKPPGATTLEAGAAALKRRVGAELKALPLPISRSKVPPLQGFGASPVDLRPADPALGRALARGDFTLAGATLDVGSGGDPWSVASPSRRFALQLHRFAWLHPLIARPEQGPAEALRLVLQWVGQFGTPSPFVWGAEALERRVYNLSCALGAFATVGATQDGHRLAESLARQTRALAELGGSPQREAERLAAAAIGATALAGRAGAQLLETLLPRLSRALDEAVLADGGLRTRSPQQGLELLFDLLTLDDSLYQRGREAPAALGRALERLKGAVRFFTLADGALASFQGGETASAAEIQAALAKDKGEHRPYSHLPQTGYYRLASRGLQVMVDTGAPAHDGWSETACAQPLAMEVVAGADRLFANTGWGADALGPSALRLPPGGNTLALNDGSPGAPLTGWRAETLGPRLVGGAAKVKVLKSESDLGQWLEATHDGWLAGLGLMHERRLFLDGRSEELRGEDRLSSEAKRAGAGRTAKWAVRFHVPPEVKVSLALDGRSVLLQGPSHRRWSFRTDAAEVALEPSAHFRKGLPHRSVQVVLRGEAALGGETRVRWKLSPVEPGAHRS